MRHEISEIDTTNLVPNAFFKNIALSSCSKRCLVGKVKIQYLAISSEWGVYETNSSKLLGKFLCCSVLLKTIRTLVPKTFYTASKADSLEHSIGMKDPFKKIFELFKHKLIENWQLLYRFLFRKLLQSLLK